MNLCGNVTLETTVVIAHTYISQNYAECFILAIDPSSCINAHD